MVVSDFDPDAWLAANPPAGSAAPPDDTGGPKPFDPDAWLAQTAPPNPAGKQPEQAPEQTPTRTSEEDDTPGIVETLRKSYARGVAKQMVNEASGLQVFTGQKTLDDFAQEALRTPEQKDAIDRLNDKSLAEGWTSVPWWMQKLGSNVGAMTPGLGYALGAGAATAAIPGVGPAISPVAGVAAFAGEAALSNIVPSYVQAKKEGLSDELALRRALTDSGTAAAFATAMGFAGKLPLTKLMPILEKGPREAMVQMGIIQPSLMAGQDIATSELQGKGMPGAGDIATDMIIGSAIGVGVHNVYKGVDKIAEMRREAAEQRKAGLASEQTMTQAAEGQAARGIRFQNLGKRVEPAVPGLPIQQEEGGAPEPSYDRDPVTNEPHPQWYSQVGRVIDEKMPANASIDQVWGILRNSHLPQEVLDRSFVPQWLEDQNGGPVNKKELLAHIEANAIQIKDFETGGRIDDLRSMYESAWEELRNKPRAQWTPEEIDRVQGLYEDFKAAKASGIQALEHDQPYYWLPGPQVGRRELVMYMESPIDIRARQLGEAALGAQGYEALGKRRAGSGEGKDIYYKQAVAEYGDKEVPYVTRDFPHWGELPNPIAHQRFEVRRGPTGQETLVNIENQSLHQEARKEGYIGEKSRPEMEILNELSPAAELARTIRAKYVPQDKRSFLLQQTAWNDLPLNTDEKQAIQRYQTLFNEHRKSKISDEERVVSLDLPFKSDWQELAVKRALRYAVDNGFPEIGFINGDMAGLRLGTRQQLDGARASYANTWKIAKKWAKTLGMETEVRKFADVTPETQLQNYEASGLGNNMTKAFENMKLIGKDAKPFNNNVLVLKLNSNASETIRKGMPYDKDLDAKAPRVAGGRTLSDMMKLNPNAQHLVKAANKIDKTINQIGSELGLTRAVEFRARPMPDQDWRGRMLPDVNPATGNYVVEVNLSRIFNETDLYASMSHEFGHVIEADKMKTASAAEKASIYKAYNDYIAQIDPNTAMVGAVRRMRDNWVSLKSGARASHDGLRVSDLTQKSQDYFLGQQEWFAEQVAKWMTTDAKPLGVVDSFFKRIGNALRKMFTVFSKAHPGIGTPDQAVADFLNRRWSSRPDFLEPLQEQHDMDTQKAAKAAFDREGAPETKAVPQEASSNGGRSIFKALGLSNKGGDAMASHGDRMNRFFKLFLGLPQIQQLNKGIPELAYYTDDHRMANTMKNEIMAATQRRMQQWSSIRDKKQQTQLTGFIDEYANGRIEKDIQDGQFRRPTPAEFTRAVKKWGLTDQSVRLFDGVRQDFDMFLERYRAVLTKDAQKIKDPIRRQNSLTNINNRIDKYLERPFMPLTRFGKYTITVYDENHNIKHFEQTNSLRQQKKIYEALNKHVDRLPNDTVLMGEVPKAATPFLGMPPGMIDLLAEKLNLSDDQRAMVDQLRFDYAPGHSFKHQFSEADKVPGYSTDFLRNYANFFFHGANHLARVSFGDHMRDMIAGLRDKKVRLTRAGNPTGANKLDQIVNYMDEHYAAWVDPKSDWATMRGLMFHWYLGFNPATALNNLTQTPLMTYPFLASKFGDVKTISALAKANTDLQNFYKKGTLVDRAPKPGEPNTPANFISRALSEAVTQGTISETQAHQVAAVAEDRNLLRHFGKKGEAAWLKFQEASAWMFEASEQYNRRIAFRSALELAFAQPGHSYVKEAIGSRPLMYEQLVKEKGWTPGEAGAFVAAQDAVTASQFDYSPYARPPIFRGKFGASALVFKLFAQNTLFNLANNPAMLWRWMLVMGFLGGVMGQPGAENINSFLKTMAWRIGGKDFDLEDEGRQLATNLANGYIDPDILMHGFAAKGFGIPTIMHAIGANWFPTFDMSKNIGFGNILGFDPFKPLGPVLDPEKEMLHQMVSGAGAMLGLPLNIYDFSTANDNFADLKKYETWAPRFLGNLSHAFRYAYEGQETNRAGNAVVRFNVGDTEQMMEILGRALGMQPRRLTEEWARIQAQSEAATLWDLRRQGLMRQFAEAVKTQSDDDKERVIEAIKHYNSILPEFARGKAITSQGLRSSVQKRMRDAAMQAQGLPVRKANIPISQEVEKYYPRGWPQDLQKAKPVN